jgi:hypothetical protein
MNNQKLSGEDAYQLIAAGQSLDMDQVQVNAEIDAMKAFHLRKQGIHVPDHLITYHDEAIQYDEDFDDGEWTSLPNTVDETTHLQIAIELKAEVRSWVEEKDIQLDELLTQLLEHFYQAKQMVDGKS